MERSIREYETDRKEAVKIAARLILASGTTTPRVGGVGECTIHIFDDPCDIEDICQKMEAMAEIKKSWNFFNRDAAMVRDADALLITTSLRCLNDPADINGRIPIFPVIPLALDCACLPSASGSSNALLYKMIAA
ncbi:MAG: hypothetical protein HUK40_05865 [Desulfobacter sp.]|nr:hypothetical protein [Desulfobacter sp.]